MLGEASALLLRGWYGKFVTTSIFCKSTLGQFEDKFARENNAGSSQWPYRLRRSNTGIVGSNESPYI
jgi:hypothetical protein